MAKKKQTFVANYGTKTVVTDNEQIIDVIRNSDAVFITQQAQYNDGSESLTVQIHFTPENIKT